MSKKKLLTRELSEANIENDKVPQPLTPTLPTGRSEQEVVKTAYDFYQESLSFVLPKRVKFRELLRLYNNQKKKEDKLGDTSIYNIINTFLAIYYIDTIEVVFGNKKISGESQAKALNKLAEFDYSEMGLEEINYLVQFNRFFYGVGIKWISGFSKTTITPQVKSISPLSWLPDPRGHTSVDNFRFMGFEVEYDRTDITSDKGFFNVDMITDDENQESANTRLDIAMANALNAPSDKGTNKANKKIDMVEMLLRFDGIPYLISMDSKGKHLFRCEQIEPITLEEKADPRLVPFPVSLHYYSPLEGNPFGVSVCDLSEDKQRMKAVLKNLRLNFLKSILYPMYLYNKNKIRNKRDLDFGFNKAIPIALNENESLDNVIVPMNKAGFNQASAFNEEQMLDKDMELATGADRIVQGATAQSQRTATEIDAVMANSNLKFLLGSRVNNWGEKRFWFLWWREYKGNMEIGNKKLLKLQSPLGGYKYIELEKDDFITKESPEVQIVSKLDSDRKRERDRVAYSSIYPMIINDPTKPLISKKFAERKLLELTGRSEEEIAILCPPTVDEMRSHEENELLSRGKEVEVDVENEDHLTHIIVHSECKQTIERDLHIMSHRNAYMESGQAQRDRQLFTEQNNVGSNGLKNSMTNVLTAQTNSQNGQSNGGSVSPNAQ